MNAKDIFQLGERCFEKRSGFVSLSEEIRYHFYPEREPFTVSQDVGQEFGSGLMTIYPLLVRRDLGDSFDTMLRPTNQEWFHMGVQDEDFQGDNDARRWLEEQAGRMRRAMFDRVTQFHRAVKEGDHDFAAFGQCVIQVETVWNNETGEHLLFRCWHLRDVAWRLATYGDIGSVFRKWKPCARELVSLFQKPGLGRFGVHPSVLREARKDPYTEIACRHMMVEADMYDGEYAGRKMGMPYVSIHYDATHHHVMEAVGRWSREYVIPRWRTLGTEYAVSPAALAALPEARMLQAMARTLLEAGEKAVNPPLVGYPDVIRGDVNIMAGGFTAVDDAYDERLGSPLRALTTAGKDAIPLGIDMMRDSRTMLAEAFYINKITPPLLTTDPNMTAFQAGQIVQQYIRQAAPLFTPLETEYNGGICEEVFEQMFGSRIRKEAKGIPAGLNMPRSLRGANMQFRFESPLHDAIERQKVHKFMEGKALLADSIALDPSLAALPDGKTALRDALQVIWPAKWVRSEAQVEEIELAQAQRQQAAEMLQVMQAGADVAKTTGEAAKSMAMAA